MTYEESQEIDRLIAKEYPPSKLEIYLDELKKKFRQKGLLGMMGFNKEKKEKEMNKFYKVSVEQFLKDYLRLFPNETLSEIGVAEEIYEGIKLPKRSTSGSAGYDFFSPIVVSLAPKQSIIIPTGIKCEIDPKWFLSLFPRSSFGFKYQMSLANTCGIVDADYYNCEANEGHIMAKIVNNGDKELIIKMGEAFIQGIFLPYGITIDDEVTETRTGGIGSTSKE